MQQSWNTAVLSRGGAVHGHATFARFAELGLRPVNDLQPAKHRPENSKLSLNC